MLNKDLNPRPYASLAGVFYFVSPDRQRRCLQHWISTCDLGDVVNVRQHKRPSYPGNALLHLLAKSRSNFHSR